MKLSLLRMKKKSYNNNNRHTYNTHTLQKKKTNYSKIKKKVINDITVTFFFTNYETKNILKKSPYT